MYKIGCAGSVKHCVLQRTGKILQNVDQMFDEHIQRQREWLRGDENRLIKVRKDQIYFIQHADELYELMDTDFGMSLRSVLYVSKHPVCGRVDGFAFSNMPLISE